MRRTLGIKFGPFQAGGSSSHGMARSEEVTETFEFERCVVETAVRMPTQLSASQPGNLTSRQQGGAAP